jgi:PST family polysaccharide transporter
MSDSRSISSSGMGHRVAQNTLALLGGRAGGAIFSALSSILLFRYMGSNLVGQYASLYAYLALFGWLVTFGMEPVLVREVSRRREMGGTILMSATVAGSGLALLAIVISLMGAPLLGYGQSLAILTLASIEVLFLPPLRLPTIVLQVDLRQWVAVGISLGRQLVWLTCVIALTMINASLWGIVLARLLCAVIEVLLLLRSSLRSFTTRWRVVWSQMRGALVGGAPLALTGLSVGIYHRADQVMIHNIAGDAVLGQYVAAVNVVELLGAIPVALMTSLSPVLSRIAGDGESFRRYVGGSFKYLVVVACGLSLVMSLGSALLVSLVYGSRFSSTSAILTVLVWSEVPVYCGVVILNALVALGLQRFVPLSTTVAAGLNLALNWLLIPRMGALGAAWATLASYSVGGVLMFTSIKPTRSIAVIGIRQAAMPVAVALVVLVIVWAIPIVPFEKVILSISGYAFGLWATRTIGLKDLELMWRAFSPSKLVALR